MQVDFTDPDAQALFSSLRALTRTFGVENARLIRRRLDDLKAVPSLADARGLPGRLEELKGNRGGQLSMRLVGGFRLVFRPATNPLPLKPDGGINWTQIRSITILNVENYHG